MTPISKIESVDLRGWKDICVFLNVRHKNTARKILKNLGLLTYESSIPVLNKYCYMQASVMRHKKEE